MNPFQSLLWMLVGGELRKRIRTIEERKGITGERPDAEASHKPLSLNLKTSLYISPQALCNPIMK